MTTQEEIILAFKKKFGVSIVADKNRLDIDIGYNRADEEKANRYVESFLGNELSIYSNNVLKQSRLSRIVLCNDLASLGKKVAGLADLQWLGLTWFFGNQILIDVAYPLNTYARLVIHHELYHLIDSVDDFNGLYDNAWKKLNSPKFKYNADLPPDSKASAFAGFISTYSMQAVHEDKAETFAHMIVDYKGIEKLAKKDFVLKSKIRRMKELMKTFSSEFDDDFWQARAKASTAAGHW
ncbi:MAG: hypothetical protein IT342_11600 [Candidatus Melainabacteria bacterium]|nr:hypothetical protein [Candidatus Melainabacteria bacterium]